MSSPTTLRRNEAESLADQLERAFEGDAWNGPTVSEILSGISAAQASARPIPGVHTIWEIVLHTAAWQRTVRERLQGRPVAPLPDSLDWPQPEETSDTEWAEAIRNLREEYEQLKTEALAWSDRDLATTLDGERYSVYEMLHGVVQHTFYHAGQIAILRKAVEGVD